MTRVTTRFLIATVEFALEHEDLARSLGVLPSLSCESKRRNAKTTA